MSDTARLLAENVGAFLEALWDSGEEKLLAELQANGFGLVLASEENGGLGSSWSEAAVVARLWGYHAAPLPIVEMLLAAGIASVAGDMTLATELTIAPLPAGDGEAARAASCPGINRCLVAHEDGTAMAMHPIRDGDTVATVACETMVQFAPRPDDGRTVPAAVPRHHEIMRRGSLLTVARMLGAMERVVEIIVEHAKTRTQFGRPLARFQLVQALISDAASETEATRAVLDRALDLLDHACADEITWIAAKSQAGRAATLVAANAHQLMAGIGFTQEHALHLFTRRLWSWRDAWLPQAQAEEMLGGRACGAGATGLWSLIADDPHAAA